MLVDYSLLIHAQRLRVNRSPAWPGVEESAQGWTSQRDCDGKTMRRGRCSERNKRPEGRLGKDVSSP